jgi:hypothetical protein
VVARHDDRPADPVRVANERPGPLELAGPRPLGEITGDRDDVELSIPDRLLDRVDLLGHRGPAEVQVRDVKDGDDAHSREITASVN